MSDTPVSTTSVTDSFALAEEIKTYKTTELISFLQLQNFELVEEDLEIIRKQRVNGRTFFKITKDELERHGMKLGPATTLVEFAKEYKELKQCIRELKRRLRNMGSVVADSNEAMRCEYISVILHASLHIVKRVTKKDLILEPHFEVIGEESTSHVDYAIKALEELICITEGKSYQVNISFAQNLIQCESALQVNKKKRKTLEDNFDYIYGIVTTATEWYFILYTTEKISCTSQESLNIRLVRSALNENSEAEKELCKNVKRVMEVIVGLLKDRLEVEREPSKKKNGFKGILKNRRFEIYYKKFTILRII
ncbi:hypothetical protein RhiirC2_770219 [Rhizophagus irregularis]|uniref:SAM domain-containing protein n=1 Tax=Rhizophagus irregularis TaxID=588596 RepID=A0A2N1NWZ1_9GLOM|nr:hypothetical protein RhiirC2_770219 [Rhizophagus irregularis]